MKRQSYYTIRDEGSSLLIRAEARWNAWQRFVAAAIPGVVIWLVVNDLFHIVWSSIVGLAFAVLVYFAEARKSKAELRVSALECYSKATLSKGISRGRIVLTGDILWLEYNEPSFSVSDGIGRAGLYAVRRTGSICLLPLLNPQQTSEIVAAIETKFSGLAEGWRKNSPLGKSVQAIPPGESTRFV
jgi:hypothetical protein